MTTAIAGMATRVLAKTSFTFVLHNLSGGTTYKLINAPAACISRHCDHSRKTKPPADEHGPGSSCTCITTWHNQLLCRTSAATLTCLRSRVLKLSGASASESASVFPHHRHSLAEYDKMSASNDDLGVITKDNIQKFYVEDDPVISEQCKAILTNYSGIRETDIVPHVRKVVRLHVHSQLFSWARASRQT